VGGRRGRASASGARSKTTARGFFGLAIMGTMAVVVYLDQMKWIDLSRAYWRVAGGERYREVLEVLTALTATGDVVLPLSVAHIKETWRQTDDARRRRLAHVRATCRVMPRWQILLRSATTSSMRTSPR
jgi:hypothetical protein